MRLTSNSGRRGLILLVTIAAALLAAVPRPAAGQGTMGSFADPISTRELMTYADRLHLSPAQRLAIEAFHDEYKDEFRALREGEIARFMDSMRSFAGTVPQREAAEKFVRDMERLNEQIAAVDDRLLTRLTPVLSPDQVALLPRVRLARERTRLAAQSMMSIAGRPAPDLSALVTDLDLDPGSAALIDPLMASYEHQLTDGMRKLSRASGRMMLDVLDVFEQAGFADMDEEDMSDPETMQKMMETLQQAWAEIAAKSMELGAALGKLNRETCRALQARLPAEPARTLRNELYRQAYPESFSLITIDEEPWMKPALRRDDLTDEQRRSLETALDEHHRRMAVVIEEAVDLAESRRRDFSPFDAIQGEDAEDFYRKFQELSTRAGEISGQTRTLVGELLGEDLGERVLAGEIKGPGGIEEGVEPGAPPQVWLGPTDQLLPGPISAANVEQYARSLGLGEGEQLVLQQLHADYQQQFGALPELERVTTAAAGQWIYDEQTGESTGPTDQSIDELYAARRAAFDAIRQLDDAFFADVAATVAPKERSAAVERLRGHRARQRYRTESGIYWGLNDSDAGSVDLADLLAQNDLSDDERTAVDAPLADYEGRVEELFRQRYDATVAMNMAQDRWQAALQAAEDGTDRMTMGMRYQEMLGPASRKLDEANEAIRRLNQSSLEQVAGALQGDRAVALRDAYNRRAFPSVYEDPAAVQRHLTSALRLTDLSGEQRGRLNELAASYRPEYDRLSLEMVAILETFKVNTMNFESGDWEKYMEREATLEKVRFERNELSFRAANHLRAVLNPEQIERIGGLPKAEEDQPWYYP